MHACRHRVSAQCSCLNEYMNEESLRLEQFLAPRYMFHKGLQNESSADQFVWRGEEVVEILKEDPRNLRRPLESGNHSACVLPSHIGVIVGLASALLSSCLLLLSLLLT